MKQKTIRLAVFAAAAGAMTMLLVPAAAERLLAQDAGGQEPGLADQIIQAMDKSDYDKAIDLATSGLAQGPGAKAGAWLHWVRGNAYDGKQQYAPALRDLDEAVRLDPGFAEAYKDRGNVHFEQGDNAAAIKDYDAAIQADPKLSMAYVGRGNAYDESGDAAKALADYTEAIQLDPKSPGAYINRAVTYNRRNSNDKAIADCNTALGLDPRNTDAYEDRAIAYMDKKNYDKALADFGKVLELDPKYAEAYAYRGMMRENMGEPAAAARDLAQALALTPDEPNLCNDLAWLLATCPDAGVRDGKKAVDYATRACETTQWRKANEVDTLAAAYAEAGDFGKAVKFEQWYLSLPGVDEKQAAEARKRLESFQAGKPWRQARQ